MKREELITLLLQNFLKALFESLKPFPTPEEKVDLMETLIEYLKETYSVQPSIPAIGLEGYQFDSEGFIRKNILLKYKDKAKPFVQTGLRYYFEKDDALKSHLFEALKIEEPVLNEEEYENYINYVHQILHNLIEKVCIQSFESAKADTEKEVKAIESEEPATTFKSKSKEYTRARQILLFYFVLQLLGKSRQDTSLVALAEFGHALFAWPTDNPNNNAVYRMLKDAPYLKENDKAMRADLEFVKKQFERIGHAEGVKLVQAEIDSIRRTQ